MPQHGLKLEFAKIQDANDQEIKALKEFIQLKEWCSSEACTHKAQSGGIEEAKWLLQYLKKTPQKDKFRIWE